MSEEFPTMVTDKKDVVCMAEFILVVLYFGKLISRKFADREWRKLARKWDLKSTHRGTK